jgi:nucleotide-binding universal stress UspA family protein
MAVIVAVDESGGSWSAIRLAASEARWRQSPLIAVIADRDDRATGVPAGRPLSTPRTVDDDQAAAETAAMGAINDALGDESGQLDLQVMTGLSGRAIVAAAREARAQLIVLAARSGISVLPGTVSQYVLRNARCPVLVVPAG